ncbi:MAG: hypothetical protein ICV83_04045 [Cytophagales bacterium]|nr:hypothetical protein [Cytophagales bacterium]
MKIIQSFWTKPLSCRKAACRDSRYAGGWASSKYNFISWAFSCLQLLEFYDEVELVTDSLGRKLLIDKIGLPYTHVVAALDHLANYDSHLWALGKIHAYHLQDRPFLHVDGDVYIWQRFPEAFEAAPLIVQNLENNFPFYRVMLRNIEESFGYVPVFLKKYNVSGQPVHAYNAGIMGGCDVKFFRNYTNEALKFVDFNISNLCRIPVGQFNAVYEQHLLYCLAEEWNIPVSRYTEVIEEDLINTQLKGLDNFCEAPVSTKYIHLFGDCKRDARFCLELENKFRKKYPEYHSRIIDLLERGEI